MQARRLKWDRVRSVLGRIVTGLIPCAALLVAPPATAQVTPGNTGAITVLAEGLDVPTTVAVRDGIAFVTEGQLDRRPVLGGLFQARAVSLEGAGILGDPRLRILLPGNDFFPEGIAVDQVTGDVFVGSVFNGIIEKFPIGATRQQFVGRSGTPGALQHVTFGLKVDNARNLLWACDSDPTGAGSALTGLNLSNASIVVTHALTAGAVCNDLFLDAAGNLLITDSRGGLIFRVDAANALTRNSARLFLAAPETVPLAPGGFGANGIAIAGGVLFVANTSAAALVRFDLEATDVAGSATFVTLREGADPDAVLSGPDGLLPLSDTELLVVENGFAGVGNKRLVRVDFDPL